jgi:signal transduction histidine kinase
MSSPTEQVASPARRGLSSARGIVRFREVALLVAGGALAIALMLLLWEGIERGVGPGRVDGVPFMPLVSSSLVTAVVVIWIAFRQRDRRLGDLESEIDRWKREVGRAQAAFHAVAERAPGGLWILDNDCDVLYANSEARRIHGCDVRLGEAYPCHGGRPRSETVCRSCPTRHTLVARESAQQRGYRTQPATGEVIAVETHPVQLSESDNYALVVEKVVTEQHKLQASLLHQEKMAAVGLLAAGVAHDLGNPLSGIEMHLQLLQAEALPDDARDSVATVRHEVARLRRTLRDLVDFARRRRSEASLVSVHAVIGDALRLVRYDHRMRHIETDVRADPDVPPVYMVEDHLMQVALNLMLNSLDAMADGGKLQIEVQPTASGVVLRVHDTGVGMSREVLDQCCEPLFSTKPHGRGTGLGLSMCKDILRAAGGELELHSAPGQGTTAVVMLPAAPAVAVESREQQVSEMGPMLGTVDAGEGATQHD